MRKAKPKPNSLTNGEESLEEEVERAMAMFPSPIPEARECTREDLRLAREYPGKLVAFIDTWRRRGGKRQLTRTVLAAAPYPSQLEEQLDRQHLTPKKRKQIKLDFIPDPALGLPIR